MKSKDLDAIKLVDHDNLATEHQTLEAVEMAVEQGCSSWGVTLRDSCTLRLVYELRTALMEAEASEQLHNKLKGEQLAHGRTKKKLEEALSKLGDLDELQELLDNVPDA
jgi:hypothetical protein